MNALAAVSLAAAGAAGASGLRRTPRAVAECPAPTGRGSLPRGGRWFAGSGRPGGIARPATPEAVPRLRLQHLWVLLTLAAAFVVPSVGQMTIVDLGWTLQSGAWMVERQRLLVEDPFTSAPAALPQVNAQWLAQLFYYGLYRLGGLELVVLGNALASLAAFGLVLAACLAASHRLRLSCACTLGALLLAHSNLGARPQTLVYPLFGLVLLALVRWQVHGRSRLLGLVPLALLLWANLHGSYVLGLLLVGGAGVGAVWQARRWAAGRGPALLLGVGLLATFLNPYGPGLLAYVARIGGNTIIREFLGEWAPASVASLEGALTYASLGLVGGLALRTRARLSAFEWLALGAFGWLALSSVRSVVWWSFVAAPVLARLAAGLLPAARPAPARQERPALNAAIALAVVLVGVLSLPWMRPMNGLLPPSQRPLLSDRNPAGAAAFLREQRFTGTLLNHADWGGYLDWAVWPAHQAFIDTRAELHPEGVWLDYLFLTYPGADWRELADRYRVGYAVLSRERNADLVAALSAEPGWRLAYDDGQAVVLAREGAAGSPSSATSSRPSS